MHARLNEFVCLYCKSDGDLDMFCIVSDPDRGWMCLENDRVTCSHRRVCGEHTLKEKGPQTMELLLADFRRIKRLPSATVLGSNGSTCFGGWVEGKKVFRVTSLKDKFNDVGLPTHKCLLDYIRDLKHSSETQAIQHKLTIRDDPKVHSHEKDVSNIEYHVGVNRTQDAIFRANVTSDLLIAGYTVADLPRTVEERLNFSEPT